MEPRRAAGSGERDSHQRRDVTPVLFAAGLRSRPTVPGVTLYTSGRPSRAKTLRVLRTRFGYWLLFVVPAAVTPLAWNNGYPETAGLTGLAATIGLVWFVRVWRQTQP
jgi:hypothetical protein